MLRAFLLFSLLMSSALMIEGVVQTYPRQIEKDPQIVNEPDQTDIFAIPLDEDEDDQEEELYDLEHPKR